MCEKRGLFRCYSCLRSLMKAMHTYHDAMMLIKSSVLSVLCYYVVLRTIDGTFFTLHVPSKQPLQDAGLVYWDIFLVFLFSYTCCYNVLLVCMLICLIRFLSYMDYLAGCVVGGWWLRMLS